MFLNARDLPPSLLSLPPLPSSSPFLLSLPPLPLSRDIQERYRTLAMYKQPVTEEEQQWSGELETQWRELAAKARQRDRDIIPDKRRFTVVSTHV